MNSNMSRRNKYVASPHNSCMSNGVSPKVTSNGYDNSKLGASPQNSCTIIGASPKSASNGSTICDSRTPLSSMNHQVGGHPKGGVRRMSLPSHLDSYQISDLMNPPRGIRDEMIRRGITPRNHHRENRAYIAKTSAKNHALRFNKIIWNLQ